MSEGGQTSKQILEILHGHQPTVRRFQQSFSYAQLTIAHQHTIEVQIARNSVDRMEIRNHYSVREGQRLLKRTEVHFEDRVVSIYDSLSLLPHTLCAGRNYAPEEKREAEGEKGVRVGQKEKGDKAEEKQSEQGHQGEEQKQKRKQIMKRKSRKLGASRDTKNVVKNILRMFKNWLRNDSREPAIRTSFFEKRKFNNSLVFAIAYEPTPRKAFLEFLQNSARQMLEESKVQDKGAHEAALQNYKSLCLGLEKGASADGLPSNADPRDRVSIFNDSDKI